MTDIDILLTDIASLAEKTCDVGSAYEIANLMLLLIGYDQKEDVAESVISVLIAHFADELREALDGRL